MSGKRFNPPPTWPLPRNWTPPPEWEPDRSWPPAPPGWQFWVDSAKPDNEQPWAPAPPMRQLHGTNDAPPSAPYRVNMSKAQEPPPRQTSHKRTWLIAAVAALVVSLTAGVVGAVSWLTDDPTPAAARPADMLPGTYPTAPGVKWQVPAAKLTSGAEPAIATPVFGAAYYGSPGAVVVGNHIVVHSVADRSSGENAQRVSINLSDGHVEWSKPVTSRDGCARELLGDLLACKTSEAYGPTSSRVDFIDINNGTVQSSATVPFALNMLASDGQSLYTAGYDGAAQSLVVAKGSVEDPLSGWRAAIADRACEDHGSGDAYDLTVRDGILTGFQGGGAYIALKTADGSPIFDHPVTEVSVLDGPIVTARRCATNLDMESWVTEVADGSGKLLFTTRDRLQTHALDVHAGSTETLVTADGTALDAATGDVRWRSRDWPTAAVTTAVVGDALMYQGGQTDYMQASALGAGTNLWGASPAAIGDNLLTDGRNLLSVLHNDIQARSISDGTVHWSIPVPAATDQDTVILVATDAGLLYITGRQIGLMEPTGPAAPVPGTSAPDEQKSAGDAGTRLITKCGSPPRFEPQEMRTDAGALVITMRIVAKCPAGDVLSGSSTRVAVTTSDGQNVASGVFDLSARPIVISSGGSGSGEPSVTHEFHFPPGTFWRVPVSMDEAPDNSSTRKGRVDIDATTLLVQCEPDGSASGSGQSGANADSSTATGAARPVSGDDESASFDALRALANSDRPFVGGRLADRWVPQLSSKRPGLVADGKVWNNAETLREHLDLRLRYPEVRLLWSGDWSTFSAPDFWITIAGVTFTDSTGALSWCRSHGLDRDHCYAKLVSTTHPIDGSTAFNP